jgi:hypothetical protein
MKSQLFKLALYTLASLVFFFLALELWMLFSLIYLVYLGIAMLLLFISLVTLVMRKKSLMINHLLLMLFILAANFGADYTIQQQVEMSRQRAEKVIEKLEEFQAQNAVLPDKLDQLVPEYLSEREICTAFGLGIKREPFGYKIYSPKDSPKDRHFRLSFEKGLMKKLTYKSHSKEWIADN